MTTDTTYIAGGLFEVVATSTDTEYRHNIIADGQVIAVHTITAGGAASTRYLHYNDLGSVNAITNGSGSVIQQMSFDAFGNRRLANNWDYGVSQNTLATMNNYTNRGYTDQEQLDNLSLVDMNGRVYDPTVGRFLSADPTGGSGPRRYTYGMDSPLVYTDPSGFDDCSPSNDDPTATCNAKLLPVKVVAFPPDLGGGGISSGSGSGPGAPVQGNDGGTIELGKVDVNGKATNNSASNAINLGKVDVNGQKPSDPSGMVYVLAQFFDPLLQWQQALQQQQLTCNSALAEARKNQAAVQRAMGHWSILSLAGDINNVNPAFLAAIGVRETGFQDISEVGGGPGVGVFQLTVGFSTGVTADEARNLVFSSFYVAQMLNANRIILGNKFPSFTGPQLFQATAASYNLGVPGISGNPNTIDQGSAHNDYGSNVVGLTACFR